MLWIKILFNLKIKTRFRNLQDLNSLQQVSLIIIMSILQMLILLIRMRLEPCKRNKYLLLLLRTLFNPTSNRQLQLEVSLTRITKMKIQSISSKDRWLVMLISNNKDHRLLRIITINNLILNLRWIIIISNNNSNNNSKSELETCQLLLILNLSNSMETTSRRFAQITKDL